MFTDVTGKRGEEEAFFYFPVACGCDFVSAWVQQDMTEQRMDFMGFLLAVE